MEQYCRANRSIQKNCIVPRGESEGFDNLIIKKINKLISIKKIGHGESLNVAMAGSILMNYLSQK